MTKSSNSCLALRSGPRISDKVLRRDGWITEPTFTVNNDPGVEAGESPSLIVGAKPWNMCLCGEGGGMYNVAEAALAC